MINGPYSLASFLKVQAALGTGSVNKKPEWVYSSM